MVHEKVSYFHSLYHYILLRLAEYFGQTFVLHLDDHSLFMSIYSLVLIIIGCFQETQLHLWEKEIFLQQDLTSFESSCLKSKDRVKS